MGVYVSTQLLEAFISSMTGWQAHMVQQTVHLQTRVLVWRSWHVQQML